MFVRMSMRSGWKLALLLIMLCLARPFHAQTNPNLEAGQHPFGSYDSAQFDQVNLQTGSLNVRIPLFSYPQRGDFQTTVVLRLGGKRWSNWEHDCQTEIPPGSCEGTWHLGPKVGEGLTSNDRQFGMYIMVDDGLPQLAAEPRYSTYSNGTGSDIGAAGRAIDEILDAPPITSSGGGPGSGGGTPPPTGPSPAIQGPGEQWIQHYIFMPDGSKHYMLQRDEASTITVDGTDIVCLGCHWDPAKNAPTALLLSNGSRVTFNSDGTEQYEDRNGNLMQSAGVDTVGRNLYSAMTGQATDTIGCDSTQTSATLITLPGPGDAPGVNTRQVKLCYQNEILRTAFGETFSDDYGATQPISESATPFTPLVLAKAIIYSKELASWAASPAWTFEYNNGNPGGQNTDGSYKTNYGDLTKITLPTGGTISYGWYSNGVTCAGAMLTPVGRWLNRRTVNAYDGLGALATSYTLDGSTATVTDPASNYVKHTFSSASGVAGGCLTRYESDTEWHSADGTLLRSAHVDASAVNGPPSIGGMPIGMRITAQTTTLDHGKAERVETDFDQNLSIAVNNLSGGTYTGLSYNKLMNKREYDYRQCITAPCAAGTLVRCTQYDYKAFADPSYLALNEMDLPLSQKVYSGACTGTLIAEKTYGYDENTLQSSPGTDSSGYLKVPPSTVGLRGNQTSINHLQLQPTGPTISSLSSYYDTGKLYTATDPNQHTTTYTYDPSYFGVYLTKTQMPSTNSVTHVVSGTYDFNQGVISSFTDQNLKTSQYSYDSLGRIVSASFPDTGLKTISYPTLQSIQQSEKISNSQSELVETDFDGLGRQVETQLLSDPQGTIFTTTTYDNLGNTYQTSTPFRSTTESSYGLNTFVYDALGRLTAQTDSDGLGQQSWSYNDNTVTYTNENGNAWQRTSDALGRLTQVIEPTGSSTTHSFETDYVYNALDDLTSVAQTGSSTADTPRTARSFVYDSLSRLTSATNPESGLKTYTYDGNGNVVLETSPMVNAASGTQTISYCYDELNRLKLRYLNTGSTSCSSPATTEKSVFAYDGSLLSGSLVSGVTFQNAVGKLTDEQAFTGNTMVSERVPYNFDPMGRLKTEQQIPYAPSSLQLTTSHTYDLAGHAITSGNTATNITVGYGFDNAGRLNGITSNLTSYGASTYPATLYSVNNYSPVGISGATYAGDPNSTGLFNLFRYYDSRGRVVDNEVFSNNDHFGTATVTINGSLAPGDTGLVEVTAGIAKGYQFGIHDDVNSISSQIAYQFNHDPQSAVTATVGNTSPSTSGADACAGGIVPGSSVPCAVITFKAIELGIYGNNIGLSASANSSSTSFHAIAVGIALSGGTGSPQGAGFAYVYTLGYDKASNITRSADPYNSSWLYTYDAFNRLKTSTYYNYDGPGLVVNSGPNPGTYSRQCWEYDGFGNRTGELYTTGGCPTPLTSTNSSNWSTYNSSNHIQASNIPADSDPNITSGAIYDGAGNVVEDPLNLYAYDSQGRLCAVERKLGPTLTQYIYDAEGQRVAKGTIHNWPGATWIQMSESLAAGAGCVAPTSANNFQLTETNLLGLSGGQEVELDFNASGNIQQAHQNVYADGGLLATYTVTAGSDPALYFNFNDWLGTKRLEVNAAGQAVNWWSSDPFGDYLNAHITSGSGPCPDLDATEHHFTGKERDCESGNDYFGARYYASSMGRFMSPDWSAKEEPVPYAKLDDPQSLNLYSYVLNNPLSRVDPDGHQNPVVDTVVTEIEDSPAGQAIGNWAGGLLSAGFAWGSGVAQAVWDANVKAGGPASTGMYPTTFNSDATDRGRANEGKGLAEVGATKNTTPSTTTDPKTGKEVTTIPDGKMPDGQHVEVKDTNVVRSTPQIRGQGQASVAESGKKPILVTGTHTKVSKSVDAAKGGTHIVVRTPKLGPQQ
jgi:RHS repeat-associated protein